MLTISSLGISPNFYSQRVSCSSRFYSIKTSLQVIDQYDPTVYKITNFNPNTMANINLPMQKKWETSNGLVIRGINNFDTKPRSLHYFCGGLPALMQAARKVEFLAKNHLLEEVIYVNDGQIPKSLQSGHQAHVHPSEWSAEDCSIWNLSKTLLRGMSLLPEQDPTDLPNYSYLHFPLSVKEITKAPFKHLKLYTQFFRQRLYHTLLAKNGVSHDDRWLCHSVVESLNYHKNLSERIEKQQGHPTFSECSRVYWSPNAKAMLKKERVWTELGIDCSFMSPTEIQARTLLKNNSGLSVLRIHRDGKFYPETPQRITRYFQENYSNIFSSYEANVKELRIDKITRFPVSVLEQLPNEQTQEKFIKSFFGSLGHNQVREEEKPLWLEVPVSGNSVIWKNTVSIQELRERSPTLLQTPQEILDYVRNLLPAANLSNLHVTAWEGEINKDHVVLYLRASQGANFNSLIANKQDLRNMWENLNTFFIGEWELLSAGTCSRKTHISNVPEYVELSSSDEYPATFLHGLSGIGYSFSGASLETIKLRAPNNPHCRDS